MIRPHAGRLSRARALPILGLSLAALAAAGQALAGPLSGLPWPSGAKDGLACLAQGRGRPMDVQHVHVGLHGATWADQVYSAQHWVADTIRTGPPMAVVSFWLLTDGTKGQFAACAAGQFDSYWQAIGSALKAAAGTTKTVVVEPGWEANLGSRYHAWGVDDVSQLPAYKGCFRHAAAALRSTFPGVVVSWSNSRHFRKNYSVDQMNPGDQYFDAYGLLSYDGYPQMTDQATWDKYAYLYGDTGPSPAGIGSWLKYATDHGKKMGVSEWGLWDTPQNTTPQADNPFFIDSMFKFFKANAASIAYETYQNNNTSTTDGHQLCPTTTFPRAQAMYARRWRAG